MDGESVGYFLSVEIKISSFCFHYGIFFTNFATQYENRYAGNTCM